MIDLLSPAVVSRLVGVIDLKDHLAVHAVAGNRAEYQPVPFCDGDPFRLVKHYTDLGVAELYVADLDALEGREMQTGILGRIADLVGDQRLIIDIGWTGHESRGSVDAILDLGRIYPQVFWVAATESMESTASLASFVQLVAANRLLLGLDFNSGRLLGRFDLRTWINAATELSLSGSVILDLASVGVTSGPSTCEICSRLKHIAPQWTLFSGGGIRNVQDVDSLISAGCDRCLVATALHCSL